MVFEEALVHTIHLLSQSMRQSMGVFKKERECGDLFNLTVTQLHYLHAVQELKNPSLSQLVERFAVQKPTVTAVINKLVQSGYVYKEQSTEDLRVFHVHLAAKGEQLLSLEEEGYRRFAANFIECLNATEQQQITDILAKIAAHISTKQE